VYILIKLFLQHFKVKKFTLPLYSVYFPTPQSKPDGKIPHTVSIKAGTECRSITLLYQIDILLSFNLRITAFLLH